MWGLRTVADGFGYHLGQSLLRRISNSLGVCVCSRLCWGCLILVNQWLIGFVFVEFDTALVNTRKH